MNLPNEKIQTMLVTIKEQETMEGIYRLRNAVYAKEKGWAPDQHTGMEKDLYDNENSRYVAVTIPDESGKARVIGCLRVISLQYPVMLDKEFRDLIPGIELTRESAIQIDRMAIDKKFRRKGIDLLIYRELVKWSWENNVIHWLFVVEPKHLHYLNRLGFEAVQIGKTKVFPDGVKVIAAYIDLPLVLEKFKVNNPKIHQLVMNEKIHARLVTIEDQETMEEIYRLRNVIYAEEKGWENEGSNDRVHFSVVSPTNIKPGQSFVLDIWAYQDAQRNKLLQRIKEELGDKYYIKTKGPAKVNRGALLTFYLKINSLIIEKPEDSIYWYGELSNGTFNITVPLNMEHTPVSGEIDVFIDGLKIMRIDFQINIGQDIKKRKVIPSSEIRFQKAFASYASDDRDEVLSRIQGIQKIAPNMHIFLDVISLRSGQYWEKELWDIIPSNDIFYLFWSEHAQKSKWVKKEWHCALQTKGLDFIDPIPLVPPDVAPPPRELAAKHFNDWTLMCKKRL